MRDWSDKKVGLTISTREKSGGRKMRDSEPDRAAGQRRTGLANEKPNRLDRNAPRTLDEEQAIGGPESIRQFALEEHSRPMKVAEEYRDEEPKRKCPDLARRSGGKATFETEVNEIRSSVSFPRGALPSENLFTIDELVLVLAVVSALFFSLRWVIGRLAEERVLPQAVVIHPSLAALTVALVVGVGLWCARRTKRLNKVKHLRGEMPT